MAAPSGVATNRWNQAVNGVSKAAAITSAEADTWLNAVWVGMYVDEAQGRPELRVQLEKWLVVNGPANAGTLPTAFKGWALA